MKTRWLAFRARNPLDPYEKSARHQRLLLALTAAMLLAAGICLGLLSLFFGSLYPVWARFFSYFSAPMLVFLNVLPVVLLLTFLWLLTDRPWLAFLIAAAVVIGLTYANYYKVVFRDDPLVAEDFSSALEALRMVDTGGYTIRLLPKMRQAIWLCLGGTAALLLFARGSVGRLRVRACLSLVPLALFFSSYFLWYTSDARYKSFENYKHFNRWEPAEDYASHGFVYPFLHSVKDCFPEKPEGYSKKAARALREEYSDVPVAEAEKVNFVCIMLESFTDFSEDGIAFTQDIYAPFEALKAESYTGTMLSDTIGGGTVNSERSFLTGTLMPHPSYRSSSWSYAQWLADQGYTVEGSHTGHDWYYNRKNINANLGFSEYYFMENHFDALTAREYGYDDVLLPEIRRLYEAGTADGSPYFSFSVTYQNHGTYSDSELTWGTEVVSHDGLTDAQYYIANNYFGGIADTCERLADFVDSFREDEEPVVIVLFGDHRPTLGDGNSVYEALGIDLERTTAAGYENYYATPYLIWANDAARAATGGSFSGEGPTLGAYFLMTEVFSQCGWEGPMLSQLQRELMNAVQVLHARGVYFADGALLGALPEAAEEAYRRFAIAQYALRKSH